MRLRRIIALLLVLFWCNDLLAQDSPVIIRGRYITVKDGMRDEFIEAAAKKTRRFNSREGSRRFFTWEIMDGPRQGQFVRGMSGTTWSDFDSPPNEKELNYWMESVNPYIKEQGNMQTWRYLPDLSYNGRGDNAPPSNFSRQWFYRVKPGMNAKFIEMRRKVKEVYETKKTDDYTAWYRLESGGDRSTFLFATGFYEWADLEGANFVTMYEEVHGKGSWKEFMKVFGETVQENPWSRRAEYWRYVKEASSPPR